MGRPKFLNTILGVVVAAAACSGEQPGPVASSVVSLDGAGILSCTPLPAASASAVIGKDGGILQIGPHRLMIPPKALGEDVEITATVPSEANNSIVFQPAGLQFKHAAVLTMSFENCAWGLIRGLVIAYTDDALNIKELIPSVADARRKILTGPLRHFSRYAVAY